MTTENTPILRDSDRIQLIAEMGAISSKLTQLVELMLTAQPEELAKLKAENQRIRQDARTELNALHQQVAGMNTLVQTVLDGAQAMAGAK